MGSGSAFLKFERISAGLGNVGGYGKRGSAERQGLGGRLMEEGGAKRGGSRRKLGIGGGRTGLRGEGFLWNSYNRESSLGGGKSFVDGRSSLWERFKIREGQNPIKNQKRVHSQNFNIKRGGGGK